MRYQHRTTYAEQESLTENRAERKRNEAIGYLQRVVQHLKSLQRQLSPGWSLLREVARDVASTAQLHIDKGRRSLAFNVEDFFLDLESRAAHCVKQGSDIAVRGCVFRSLAAFLRIQEFPDSLGLAHAMREGLLIAQREVLPKAETWCQRSLASLIASSLKELKL